MIPQIHVQASDLSPVMDLPACSIFFTWLKVMEPRQQPLTKGEGFPVRRQYHYPQSVYTDSDRGSLSVFSLLRYKKAQRATVDSLCSCVAVQSQ